MIDPRPSALSVPSSCAGRLRPPHGSLKGWTATFLAVSAREVRGLIWCPDCASKATGAASISEAVGRDWSPVDNPARPSAPTAQKNAARRVSIGRRR